MSRTLVLDQGFMPINVVSWQRAFSYLMRGKAEALEEYDEAIHLDFQMPAVVRLTNGLKTGRRKVKFSRSNVLSRDRSKCQYCSRKLPASELTYDHVVPRCQGGKTTWENIVMACVPCNATKGNRTPEQADMRLIRKPERPLWVPTYNPRLKDKSIPPEWRNYWTVEIET